jgi:glycosyltransferase involved in cell wall biosynthesis
LLELVPALHARSFVVHSGQNFDFYPVGTGECDAVRRRFGLGLEPYFLHVGQNHHRKNRTYLFQLLAALIAHRPALPNRLVLVGSPLSPGEVSVINACGVAGRISALGKVDGDDLRALYSGAQAMIFPSLLEGFGWPIIEAQACGCPVITSDRPPMNDIGGDAAIYIDPLDHRSGAEKIIAALSSLAGRREASLRNASRFTTERMMGEYLFAYRAAREAMGRGSMREARLEFWQ